MHLCRAFRAPIAPIALTLSAVSLAVLLAGAATAAIPPGRMLAPTLLATSNGKPRMVEGVPDTGQFLSDTARVARFDEKVFTVRDYVNAYFSAFVGDRPARDSLGRVAFLKALISKELLGQAARRVGYDLGYEGRVQMREYTQRVLANALFNKGVLDSALVTEASASVLRRSLV